MITPKSRPSHIHTGCLLGNQASNQARIAGLYAIHPPHAMRQPVLQEQPTDLTQSCASHTVLSSGNVQVLDRRLVGSHRQKPEGRTPAHCSGNSTCHLIEACIVNERAADNGSPYFQGVRSIKRSFKMQTSIMPVSFASSLVRLQRTECNPSWHSAHNSGRHETGKLSFQHALFDPFREATERTLHHRLPSSSALT